MPNGLRNSFLFRQQFNRFDCCYFDAAGASSPDTRLAMLNYLKPCPNNGGGFTCGPARSGRASDSSSASRAIRALNALGINPQTLTQPPNAPKSYLEPNQASAGRLRSQPDFGDNTFPAATTASAVISLQNKTLPPIYRHQSRSPVAAFKF